MTESEVRKLLRQMKELDSQTAFRDFYNMTYDRLFRIAYYYVKQECPCRYRFNASVHIACTLKC